MSRSLTFLMSVITHSEVKTRTTGFHTGTRLPRASPHATPMQRRSGPFRVGQTGLLLPPLSLFCNPFHEVFLGWPSLLGTSMVESPLQDAAPCLETTENVGDLRKKSHYPCHAVPNPSALLDSPPLSHPLHRAIQPLNEMPIMSSSDPKWGPFAATP